MSVSVRRWCVGVAVGGVLLVAAVVGVVQARESTPPSLGGTIEVSESPGTNGPGPSGAPGASPGGGASPAPSGGPGGRAVSPPPVQPGDDDNDDGAYGDDDGDDG
ncbi:hypothetical protein AB0L25_39795 [Spirillospora sp. NPDC052242]